MKRAFHPVVKTGLTTKEMLNSEPALPAGRHYACQPQADVTYKK